MQLEADLLQPQPKPIGAEWADTVTPKMSRGRVLLRALRHASLTAGLVICVVLTALVAAAPLLTSVDPNAQDPFITFAPPSAEHPMGADAFGRDLFSRVLYGGRTTMLASLCVVVIGCVVGTSVGLIAGYFGGALGFSIMRLVDLLLAFPALLLAIMFAAVYGASTFVAMVAREWARPTRSVPADKTS